MSLASVQGGVCASGGFLAAGVNSGIKKAGGLDLALLYSERSAAVAGVFTTNRAAAAPVAVCRSRIRSGSSRGVVVNSGCANACTGSRGYQDALHMSAEAARRVNTDAEEMLVCSTGLIGSTLPMDRVYSGIAAAVEQLSRDGNDAAEAIMTTDTRPKQSAVAHSSGWRVGGMSKGAGMIAPNMATMLAFVTTDAVVEPAALQSALSEAAESTFNAITIDGDTSTNDTVLLFANGASGLSPGIHDFTQALEQVCGSLAEQIVADGEGATKLVTVRIRAAETTEQAKYAARAVAESTLVKTAIHGQDANWGRIAAALGRSGAKADFSRLSISIAGVTVYDEGVPMGPDSISKARAAMKQRQFDITCDLSAGNAAAHMITTDLSEEFVSVNAHYET